jgi:hypothetical protein
LILAGHLPTLKHARISALARRWIPTGRADFAATLALARFSFYVATVGVQVGRRDERRGVLPFRDYRTRVEHIVSVDAGAY